MTAGGDVVEGWIRQSALRYDMPFITQVNEMMVPTILPYYPINCDGIMNGGVGAAEYEAYGGYPGEAIKLSDMMTMGGLVVLIFLVLGNIGWFMKGGRSSDGRCIEYMDPSNPDYNDHDPGLERHSRLQDGGTHLCRRRYG
jgi:hypothetical protein